MKQYIGTKLIEAEPAYRCTDNQMRVDIIVDPDEAATYYKSEEGYRVRYPDGYESWMEWEGAVRRDCHQNQLCRAGWRDCQRGA